MNFIHRLPGLPIACAGLLLLTGCDWSSGSQDNFNTSGGSSNINISGFYRGTTNGGRAVAQTSRGNITSFIIQQSGNRVEVIDNQGSTYSGSVGAPLYAGLPSGSTFPPGAAVATFQISWSGKDGVAAKDINFSGVLTLVTVTQVQGDIDTVTVTNTTNNNSVIPPTDPFDTGTGTTIDNTTTVTNTTTSTFQLTEGNAQFQLRGTWVEVGGTASTVNAIGPPVAANIVLVVDPGTGGGGGGGTPPTGGGGGVTPLPAPAN